MSSLPVVAGAALVLSLASCSHSRERPADNLRSRHAPRLILISVDGMRPDFYTKAEYRRAAPTLARMSDEGESASRGIAPVFPSITYPNHVSMVTGAYSAEHGVYSNQIYSKTLGLLDDWYFYSNEIRVQTLWDAAEKAGLKTALIRWPAGVGAKVHWDFPEIFYPGSIDVPRDWTLIQRHTDPPSLLGEIEGAGPTKKPMLFADLDQMALQTFEYLVDHEDPDLILIHLSNLDFVQHQFGTDAPEVTRAAAGIDAILAQIRKRVDPSKTTLIVTGDHGFATYRNIIFIAPLIRAAGSENRVTALADGGQSAIYPLPGGQGATIEDCRKILRASRKYGHVLTLISKHRLQALRAFPRAVCAFEAELGYVISGKASAKAIQPTEGPRGHHGYLPSRPEMRAGFFIWGRAIGEAKSHHLRGDAQGKLVMPDIAPTAASILGIPFSAPDGTAIRF